MLYLVVFVLQIESDRLDSWLNAAYPIWERWLPRGSVRAASDSSHVLGCSRRLAGQPGGYRKASRAVSRLLSHGPENFHTGFYVRPVAKATLHVFAPPAEQLFLF